MRTAAGEVLVALWEGDGDRACRLMTGAARDQAVDSMNDVLAELGGDDHEPIRACPPVVGLTAEFMRGVAADQPDAEAARERMAAAVERQIDAIESGAAFGDVEIDGTTATVATKMLGPVRSASFRQIDGDWLLDDLGERDRQ